MMKDFNKLECVITMLMFIPIIIFYFYINIKHPFRVEIVTTPKNEELIGEVDTEIRYTEKLQLSNKIDNLKVVTKKKRKKSKSEPIIQTPLISNEVELLARVIYAEAGNQDRVGKLLVADVVLNRCNDDSFPDDIISVISQPHQFETYSTGAIWKYDLDDSCIDVALQEMEAIKRYNEDVLYFRTGRFHTYGTPAFKHQDHYFNGQ